MSELISTELEDQT